MLALVATAALFAFGLAESDPPARYALELSIVRSGVTTVSSRSVVIENGSASLSMTDSEREFEMTASLNAVQGDGDGQLALRLSISDGDSQPIEPNLVFDRGETALVVIGDEDPTGRMINGLTVNITPVVSPATPSN
jgi:hypothetical protein